MSSETQNALSPVPATSAPAPQQTLLPSPKVLLPNLVFDQAKYNNLYPQPVVIYPADNIINFTSYMDTEKRLDDKIKRRVNDQIAKYQNEELKKLEMEKKILELKSKVLDQQHYSHNCGCAHSDPHHHHHHDCYPDHHHHHHPPQPYPYHGHPCDYNYPYNYYNNYHNHHVPMYQYQVPACAPAPVYNVIAAPPPPPPPAPVVVHSHPEHHFHSHNVPSLCDTNPKCDNCSKDDAVLNIENKIKLIREELNLPRPKNQKHCPHEHYNA